MALPDMGKMIGPLPLGAWLAVVGGGLGVAIYTRRQGAAQTPEDTGRDVSVDPGVGTGGGAGWVQLDPPTSTDSVANPTTNGEWGVKAIRWLISMGYPALAADQAVRNYLSGAKLGIGEQAMIAAVLVGIGPTPEVLPVPDNPIPTVPTPTPARKPYTYHTVRVTDNLASIAWSYRKNPADIWNANKKGIRRLDGSPGFLTSYALHRNQILVIPWVKPVWKE